VKSSREGNASETAKKGFMANVQMQNAGLVAR